MISTELADLSDVLLGYAARGEATPPWRMATFAALVLELSKRAAVMEDRPVPPAARLPLLYGPEEEIAMLVDRGWTETEARAFVGEGEP